MATRERPRDRALRSARRVVRLLGEEIRLARTGSGVSQRAAARAVGLARSTYVRIENGEANLSVEQLYLGAAGAGLVLSIKGYPAADPVRDAASQRLLARFRARLPPGSTLKTEVPIPIPADCGRWTVD